MLLQYHTDLRWRHSVQFSNSLKFIVSFFVIYQYSQIILGEHHFKLDQLNRNQTRFFRILQLFEKPSKISLLFNSCSNRKFGLSVTNRVQQYLETIWNGGEPNLYSASILNIPKYQQCESLLPVVLFQRRSHCSDSRC